VNIPDVVVKNPSERAACWETPVMDHVQSKPDGDLFALYDLSSDLSEVKHMPISTISAKGQITLPVGLGKRLGMKPHDRVFIESTDDAIVIKRAVPFFELQGFLGKALPETEEWKRIVRAVSARAKGLAR
jgi:AbrB family looped-hinge helix DNA binding protein